MVELLRNTYCKEKSERIYTSEHPPVVIRIDKKAVKRNTKRRILSRGGEAPTFFSRRTKSIIYLLLTSYINKKHLRRTSIGPAASGLIGSF